MPQPPTEINIRWFLRNFKKTLAIPRRTPPRPIILSAAGPSRVGKTTVFKFIQKRLPYFVRIAHDDMRLFLYGRGFPDSPLVENFLYRSAPSAQLAEKYLKRGYGVMLDDNFASNPVKLKLLKKLAGRFSTQFFVIRVWAPAHVVRRRLRGAKSKLFPDWRVGMEHFKRSRKQFDYARFNNLYLVRVNAGRPFAPQLRNTLSVLRGAMGLKKPSVAKAMEGK